MGITQREEPFTVGNLSGFWGCKTRRKKKGGGEAEAGRGNREIGRRWREGERRKGKEIEGPRPRRVKGANQMKG